MAKNKYFEYQQYHQLEQDLVKSMADECINMLGFECKWIHNFHNNVDAVYVEDRIPDLDKAKTVCIMLDNLDSPYSDPILFTRFGYGTKTNISFGVSVIEWRNVFGTLRPTEGDIIFIPQWNEFGVTDFFKITYIDRDNTQGWNTLGGYAWFHCTAEKWLYSSEKFDESGHYDVDINNPAYTNDTDVNPNFETEPFAQNNELLKQLQDFGKFEDGKKLTTDKSFVPVETEEKIEETILPDWKGVKRESPVSILNRKREKF